MSGEHGERGDDVTGEHGGEGGRNGAGPDGPATLEDLSRTTVYLAGTIRGRLKGLRVQSGEAAVEVQWADSVAIATAAPGVAAPALEGLPDGDTAETGEGARDYVCSPMVGTFYHAPEPGADPFVVVGDSVEPGQQVGIVEAMKLMNPIEAERPGEVLEILVPDATPVEYGERLIAYAPREGS